METKTVGIRYIETRKVQFLDGTEYYPEFYIKVKFTDMVYLQNGKCCRLEVVGSSDDTYNTDFEANIHFGGKAYDLNFDKHIDILAKRLRCRSISVYNSIYSLRAFIQEKLINIRSRMIYVQRHRNDEVDTFSISMDSKAALSEDWSESEYAYTLKIGDKIIPVNEYVLDQGDFGFVESITFDLGDDTKISVVYGNSESLCTTGYENYTAVVKLEKLLGIRPGDGMNIIRKIGRV